MPLLLPLLQVAPATWLALPPHAARPRRVAGALLQPFPLPHSVLVLDNCAIHKDPEFLSIIEATGAIVEFLPPYTPQYNPVSAARGVARRRPGLPSQIF